MKWARRDLHPPLRVKSPLHRSQCFEPGSYRRRVERSGTALQQEPAKAPSAASQLHPPLLRLKELRRTSPHRAASKSAVLTIKHHSSSWCARGDLHSRPRTGEPVRCSYATSADRNSAHAGLGPPAGFYHLRLGEASSDLGIRIGASLRKKAAPAGFAPALPGLKFRCPQLLDDEAVWSDTSVRTRLWDRERRS